MSGQILKRIEELSYGTVAPGKWGFLKPVIGLRELSLSEVASIDKLTEEFTPEKLEAARVLVRRSDKRLELNPVLGGEYPSGLFFARTKDDLPFDFVNLNGSLTTDNPPALSCGRDFYTQCFSGDTKSVLVAFTDEDLAVLRMLALPCTPVAGLAAMNGEQLQRLFEGTSSFPSVASKGGQTVAVVPSSYRLVLTGCSVSELSDRVPDELNAVVERFLIAEDAFGFDTARRVGIWQPHPREFSRIGAAAEFQDRVSPQSHLGKCAGLNLLRKAVPIAVHQLQRDRLRCCSANCCIRSHARELGLPSSDLAKRLEVFNRSFNKSVVDAIIHDAMLATDSVDLALLLTASELMGHWHQSSSLVRSTEDGVSGRYFPREQALEPDELKERLRVVDGLVKIHRELTRDK